MIPDEFDNEAEKAKGKTFADEVSSSTIASKLPRGYVSISQVNQYLKCGAAYKFRYMDDILVPGNNFTVQGRGVHKAAEHLHLGLMNTPDALPSMEAMTALYSDLHDKEVSDGAILIDEKDWGFVKDEGIRMTQSYRKGALGDLLDPETGFPMLAVRPIAAERIIKVMVTPENSDPIPFLGVVDLEEPDTVVDVKSKKKSATQADCDNSIQLTLYAHILGKSNVRLDQVIKPTKTMGVRYLRKSSTRTNHDVKHALNVIRDVTEGITKGVFPRTSPDGWHCSMKWCAYWGRCRGKK
jgi:hypothetical protein